MKVWTDKKGNKLTYKEFINRWKKGIEGITPKQRIKTQINGYLITMIGLVLGIIFSLLDIKRLYWLGIILLGGLIINIMQMLGLIQQMIRFKKIEELTEEKK